MVNTDKTKIIFFREGWTIPKHVLNVVYKNVNIEIVKKNCYLGVVFTAGG